MSKDPVPNSEPRELRKKARTKIFLFWRPAPGGPPPYRDRPWTAQLSAWSKWSVLVGKPAPCGTQAPCRYG